MIIVRTPLRVSLFGGGTDIDPYMTKFGGKVLSCSINKYIYLSIHPLVESQDVMLKYSINERVSKPEQIQHKVFRVVLEEYDLKGIDIAISSDIAAGTGLGSSSAFTVGLIHLVEEYLGKEPSKRYLANKACAVELDMLKEPIGIQDQFAAAFGGINIFEFNSRHDVAVQPIYPEEQMLKILSSNMLLVRVKGERSASALLLKQRSTMHQDEVIENLNSIKDLVDYGIEAWKTSAKELGKLLDKGWNSKKKLSSSISNKEIDLIYQKLIGAGFYGGKLLGAGGNGYLLMVGSEAVVAKIHLSKEFSTLTLNLDTNGSHVIYTS
jgi:D-glycero-alpha-D-manno-heptose-7-phosphate kinase